MPLVESRVRGGVILFTDLVTTRDFSCQALDVRVTPSFKKGDQVETLCGDLTTPAIETTWVLKGKVISDFAAEASSSFVRWTHTHAGESWPFGFTPNSASGTDRIQGVAIILPLELGGEVNKRIELPFEFDMTAAPNYTLL